jgi:hypothetical protein
MGLATEAGTMVDHRPMKTRTWIVPLVMVAACKGGGDGKSLEPGVFGKAVAPPGDLGKLKVGMPLPEAKKVAGKYVPGDDDSYKSFASGYTGMRYAVAVDDERTKIDRIRIEVPESAKDMLAKAWGPGVEATCMDDPCWYWFDPATQIRAKATPETLRRGKKGIGVDFYTYLPFEKLLGAKPASLGFETTPVLGASLDEARKAYPGVLVEQKEDKEKGDSELTWFELPPTPYESYWTRVYVRPRADKIDQLSIDINYRENPKAKDEILAAFEKAWGKGVEVRDFSDRPTLMWHDPATGRRAHLDATMIEGSMSLKIERYTPVEKFLGEGAEKLGWETTPLIGMADADVQKAYPEYVDPDSEGKVMLKAPATEWDDYTLVQFHRDDQGKVKQFVFTLSYRTNPAARDAIKAALVKKWGPGTEVEEYGRKSLVLREASPRVVAQENEIMKGWDLKIGSD